MIFNRLFGKLPVEGIWDHVRTSVPINRVWRLNCKHDRTTTYVRVDRRAGPGAFADNYEGTVCVECGKVLTETQTL